VCRSVCAALCSRHAIRRNMEDGQSVCWFTHLHNINICWQDEPLGNALASTGSSLVWTKAVNSCRRLQVPPSGSCRPPDMSRHVRQRSSTGVSSLLAQHVTALLRHCPAGGANGGAPVSVGGAFAGPAGGTASVACDAGGGGCVGTGAVPACHVRRQGHWTGNICTQDKASRAGEHQGTVQATCFVLRAAGGAWQPCVHSLPPNGRLTRIAPGTACTHACAATCLKRTAAAPAVPPAWDVAAARRPAARPAARRRQPAAGWARVRDTPFPGTLPCTAPAPVWRRSFVRTRSRHNATYCASSQGEGTSFTSSAEQKTTWYQTQAAGPVLGVLHSVRCLGFKQSGSARHLVLHPCLLERSEGPAAE